MIHQAFSDKWKLMDDSMCRHSMSFHLHHSLQKDFFASYLYLLEKTPLVKLFPVTCEYIKGEKQFYYRSQKFYEDVEPSEEGMLGGFLEISEVDLEQSRRFLSRFIGPGKAGPSVPWIAGRGSAGVSKGVLFPVFERMELEYLGDDKKYDVVWMQWVPVSHLTDRDLCNFLVKCKRSLRPNGVIILKDNMARHGCKLDPVDSSISRHLDVMKTIIYKAELEVVGVERQQGFPEVMMPVWMLALRPARSPDKPK
uniref:Methyltransferase like 11B n=1 Tax=Neogobius melanostomus TaxID=47308 RepID=A0A8C6S4F8_9GOBI